MRIDALLGQRVYLDTNALIYAVEGDPATQPASVAALMRAVSRNEVTAYASLLVRAEVLVLPLKTGNQPQIAFYRRLLDESGPIRMAALTPVVADAAAALRAGLSGTQTGGCAAPGCRHRSRLPVLRQRRCSPARRRKGPHCRPVLRRTCGTAMTRTPKPAYETR